MAYIWIIEACSFAYHSTIQQWHGFLKISPSPGKIILKDY